jgi:hypothetical protein
VIAVLIRDSSQAISEATKACEITNGKIAGLLATLVSVYAEAGDFANATEWQEKAIAQAYSKMRVREIGDSTGRLRSARYSGRSRRCP